MISPALFSSKALVALAVESFCKNWKVDNIVYFKYFYLGLFMCQASMVRSKTPGHSYTKKTMTPLKSIKNMPLTKTSDNNNFVQIFDKK